MTNTEDTRFRNCGRRIRDALADLLQTKSLTDISVSELSRKAKVSRATFYVHYDNVGDVFDELVGEVMDDVLSFGERFSCDGSGCAMHKKPRYCERVRSEKKLAGVVREARFFPSVMALAWEDPDAKTDAATRGIDPVVMRAVRLFQMSGCHAVASSEFAQRDDWPCIRRAIDVFIEGGLRALEKA